MIEQGFRGEYETPENQYVWRAEKGDLERIARTAVAMNLRRPGAVVYLVGLAFLFLLSSIMLENLWILLFSGVYLVAVPFISYAMTRRALRGIMSPGMEIVTGFGAESMMLRDNVAQAVFPYSSITSVNSTAELVQIRVRTRQTPIGLPSALVPPHELERIQQYLAPART